jgi:hypothetical protein
MSDDKSKPGGNDRKEIAMKEKYEVEYWTKALGVTKEELQAAVDAVGHSAEKVRAHLGK